MEELRRVLANQLYGTKPHLKKGEWETPIVKKILNLDQLIDMGSERDVIDVNKAHVRAEVMKSITRKNAEEKEALQQVVVPAQAYQKISVRKKTLRQMYEIRGEFDPKPSEKFALQLRSEVNGKSKLAQL